MAANQFNQTDVKGRLIDGLSSVFNALVDSGEAGTLVPGSAVVLSDVDSGQIVVEAAAAATDAIVGVVPYSVKTNEYVADEDIKYASRGSVITLEASAAIVPGADVEYVPTGQKVVTRTTGTIIGRALDKAAADGDLIRVEITA